MGWPLDDKTGGGSFLYHFGERLVSVGFVVHLDYANPYLNPFKEFQRAKTHPRIREHLEGGKRIAYGARALTEGGWQAIPQLVFPGGALIGCAAGFMNVPRIKGSHNAMLSGMMAAEAAFAAIEAGRSGDVLEAYPAKRARRRPWRRSSKKVRNVKPLWSRLGTRRRRHAWRHRYVAQHHLPVPAAHAEAHEARLCELDQGGGQRQPIEYQKPDGKLTFDILSSVFLSGTNHEEDQPVHLRLDRPPISRSSRISRNMPSRHSAIARRRSMRWLERGTSSGSRSTRRTASTARPAT